MEQSTSTRIIQNSPVLANRFEVLDIIGEGAAGAVYRVKDRERDGKELALKILLRADAFDENTKKRFEREIEICKELRHPNLVEAYDFIQLDDTIAYTMEFVPGADLGRFFGKRRLTYEDIDKIFVQLMSALEALHSRNIIHRDIKLENVLIREDGVVKLSDLGLVKREESVALTRTGVLLGTAQYLPPEYIKQSKYDSRGDLYAAGVVLYELLTQKRRLADKVGMEAIEYLLKTKFELPKLPLSQVPKKYQFIVERATDPKPARRFQTAQEMKQAFTLSYDELVGRKGIQMENRLSIQRYAPEGRRLLGEMSRAFVRKKKFSLGLILGAIAFGGAAAWIMRSPSNLPAVVIAPGVYEGDLNMFGNTGFLKSFRARIENGRIDFTSEFKECPQGSGAVPSGELSCGKNRFYLAISGADNDTISGVIDDTVQGKRHTFKLKRQAEKK